MEFREAFTRAKDPADKAAALELEQFADNGCKDAETVLIELTRAHMAQTGQRDFETAFWFVAQAHPRAHRAYLNANGSS